MHKFMFFMAGVIALSNAARAADSAEHPGLTNCYYDNAAQEFRTIPPGMSARSALAGSLQAAAAVMESGAVVVEGLRYERMNEANESLANLNSYMELRGTFNGVQLFGFGDDRHNDYLVAIRDPRICSLTMFHYRPELHFAWIEQDQFGLGEFLFKHSGLVVDPASFRKQGDYLRGVGFDIYSHPHKQEDGTQPRYNRTTIEADCSGKRVRFLDQRVYEAQMKLVSIMNYSKDWVSTEDVYPAIGMLAHAMCEVPTEKWGKETKLPATLDEFSDYVHAAAHGKT